MSALNGPTGERQRTPVLLPAAEPLRRHALRSVTPHADERREPDQLCVRYACAASSSELRELPQGEFHTVAGFVMFLFGKLPQTGERVEWSEWAFEVQDMRQLRVAKVRARRLAAPS